MDTYNTDGYEQLEIDVRLDSERNLSENISQVIKFTYDAENLEAKKNDREIQPVRNKHEGYGIAAEAFSCVQRAVKELKSGMDTYLAALQITGDDGIQPVSTLYAKSSVLAGEAIKMAASMHRILNDLYYGVDRRTPIEQAIDEAESEADGFEEALPARVDEETDEVEEITEDDTEGAREGAQGATEGDTEEADMQED